MITTCAQLRFACQKIGHPLGYKIHDGDRWIAAAALRLHCPLVSHDGLFKGAMTCPGGLSAITPWP